MYLLRAVHESVVQIVVADLKSWEVRNILIGKRKDYFFPLNPIFYFLINQESMHIQKNSHNEHESVNELPQFTHHTIIHHRLNRPNHLILKIYRGCHW